MRLIDADAFIAKLAHVPMVQEAIRKAMDSMPTIEPERKTGHWISERREWEYTLRCSECGYTYIPRGLEDGTLDLADVHHYCPLCGTRMKEKGEI